MSEQSEKSLQELREEIRRLEGVIENQKMIILADHAERDLYMMRALNAERELQNERFRSEAFKRRVEALESSEERLRALESNKRLMGDVERLYKTIAEMTSQNTRAEYEARELRRELEELKGKYERLQDTQRAREWANTNRNAYDDLLAMRDVLVPGWCLAETRKQVIALVEALRQRVTSLERRFDEKVKESAEWAAEAKHEKYLKEEIYKLYDELRKLFSLEALGAIDPVRVHSSILRMLNCRNDDIQELNEQLEKERALACETIRALEAKVQKLTSEGR